MLDKLKNQKVWIARLLAVTSSLFVFVLLYLSYQQTSEQYELTSSQLVQQSTRFDKLNDMTAVAAEYLPQFKKYQPIAQFEEENRPYLLDQLERIRKKHRIERLQYDFEPRKKYDYSDGIISDRGINVMVSEMKLELGLAHAGDLIAVVKDLRAIESTRQVVTSCKLAQQGTARTRQATVSAIQAECHLKWFTFKVKA